ncbi:MAG: TRAP transporter small permease [Sulfurospirillaceae bacterium]|nr:TRAP transporter small permease [Sulfurospirillaceae bacterium]
MIATKKQVENSILGKLLSFNLKIASLELRLASIMIVIASCLSLYTIIVRNSGHSTADWTVDLPIALVSWAIFIGSGANFVYKSHINTDFFLEKLPFKLKKTILIFVNFVLLGMFIFIVHYSIIATELFIKTGNRLYEMFNTPVYIVFLILPISVVIWCVHVLIDIVDIYCSTEKEGA